MSRLLFDTNLWSYLGQETRATALSDVLKAAGHEAAVAPHMLTEALRTSEVERRTRTVEMMCSPHWIKLRNAADTLSEELTAEIRRLRPEWLRSRAKTDRLHSMRDYWTKVYWREARREPEAVISRLARSELDAIAEAEVARVQAANKAAWPYLSGDLASAALSATTAENHPDPDPGSRLGWPADTAVLYWRFNARDIWWPEISRELGGPLTGHRDDTVQTFLGAFVDLATMRRDRASFNRFFLFDVEAWNVPRAWWEGTVDVVQLGTKLSTSNGADASHATYMPDCDYFATTDKRFEEVLR